MDDLSKGKRTPRPEHVAQAKAEAARTGRPRKDVLGDIQQLHDQFSLEADTLYLLAQNEENFLTDRDWQEAKTKIHALNPGKFNFDGGGPAPSPTAPPFIFQGSPNFWPGEVPPGEGLALVIHTSVSTLSSMDGTFASTGSQVSATFGIDLDGTVHQYVGVYDAAWANGILESGNRWPVDDGYNPNQRSISIETVDNGDPDNQPVTDEQYASVVWVYRNKIKPAHPEIRFTLGHYIISPLSRSCPARRWRYTGRMQQLASDTGLLLVA